MDIERISQRLRLTHSPFATFVCKSADPWQCHVAQGKGTGASNRSRHIRDAIMNDIIDHVSRLLVGRRSTRFHTTTLIDCHVDNHTSRLHQSQVLFSYQVRCFGSWNQNGADHQIRKLQLFANGMSIAKQCIDVRRHHIVQVTQSIEVDVEDSHIRLKTCCDPCSIGTDNTSTEDGNVRGRDTWHSAQKNASSHLRSLQILSPFLNTHSTCNFAHRRQQWQTPLRVS